MKRTAVLLALFILSFSSFSQAADYEIPPILEAKDFLPAALLKGEQHEVEPQVTNDGYMNQYTVVRNRRPWRAGGSTRWGASRNSRS